MLMNKVEKQETYFFICTGEKYRRIRKIAGVLSHIKEENDESINPYTRK